MLGKCSTLNIYSFRVGLAAVRHLDLELCLGEVHNYASASLKDGGLARFYMSALVSFPTVQTFHEIIQINLRKCVCDIVLEA